VQLSDSVSTTSSVLAATPTAIKAAYDIATAGWEAYTFGTAGIVATVPRFLIGTSQSAISQAVYYSRIIPHKTIAVSNIAFVCGANTTSITLVRFGIYTRSGSTMTLVARTASDTTIFATASTKYTRALDTTGGYPATYTMTAGAEYYIAVLQISSSSVALMAATARQNGANIATPAQSYSQTNQTDLPTSSIPTASQTVGGVYAEVS